MSSILPDASAAGLLNIMAISTELLHSLPAPAIAGTVFAIDDEIPMRNALRRLLSSSGLSVELFADAHEFLQREELSRPACILLDLNMPGMNGLQLQEELHARGVTIPVVFLTGAGSVAHAVEAMRAGAVDFVEKPFSNEDLIERVNKALDADRAAVQKESETTVAREKVDSLTARERQVLVLLTEGHSNKLVARKLDLSPRTVEGYRARISEKLQARSVAEFVRILQQCQANLEAHGLPRISGATEATDAQALPESDDPELGEPH
jgi:two-component system, LuxR family, response regulator FixJ